MLVVVKYEVITALSNNSSIFWDIEGVEGGQNKNTDKQINKELNLTARLSLIIIWQGMRFKICTQLWKDLTMTDTIHCVVFYLRHYVSETALGLRLRNFLF
jgi:hypothetical protein